MILSPADLERLTARRRPSIRAMAATDARAQGIDPQGLLGHSDARTTRIYLRDKVVPVVAGPRLRGIA